jgi:hypothetical protein
VQREDVRVGQAGDYFDLTQKTLGRQCVAKVGTEDLHGDGPAVAEIPGEVDRGHSPPPELALDGIAIR